MECSHVLAKFSLSSYALDSPSTLRFPGAPRAIYVHQPPSHGLVYDHEEAVLEGTPRRQNTQFALQKAEIKPPQYYGVVR